MMMAMMINNNGNAAGMIQEGVALACSPTMNKLAATMELRNERKEAITWTRMIERDKKKSLAGHGVRTRRSFFSLDRVCLLLLW